MAVLAIDPNVKLLRNTVTRDDATGDISYELEYEYVDSGTTVRKTAFYTKGATQVITPEEVVNIQLAAINDETDYVAPEA